MARPLRIEYPGAVYHITSRGNARQDIFIDDGDRQGFLTILAGVVDRCNWLCHGYCLMGNHYHLLLETPEANLSLGMRQLNGVYTQRFNRRHDRVGHLLQGRYKALLVEKNGHLLELCRYIVLNPVRAGLVAEPSVWPWSSYLATAGLVAAPEFLRTQWVLSQFGRTKKVARARYVRFVAEGMRTDGAAPWAKVVAQLAFGGEDFVDEIRERLDEAREIGEIPKSQRFFGRPSLAALFAPAAIKDKTVRNRQMEIAHVRHGYTLKEIGAHLHLHYTTVSRVVGRGRN
ncbi:MAG: transposase [Thermodesulfobacteriota bacterium]